MTDARTTQRPGEHAPQHGGTAIVLLGVLIPVLLAMVLLAIAPGILDMARAFGEQRAQLVLTVPTLAMIAGAALAGLLAERWGRRAVIIACLCLYAASGTAGYVLERFAVMIASRAVLGFAAGMLLTTIYATIGEYLEGARRERVLGFMSTAASAASVAMLSIGGKVVEVWGWRAPFLLYLSALLLVPLALSGMHRGRSDAQGVALSWGPVLKLWPLYLLLTAYTIGMYMLIIQGPFLLASHGITSAATIGKLLAVSSLFGALAGLLYGSMRRWLGFRPMFVHISLAMGVGLLLAVWAPTQPLFVLACLVVGLGIGVIEPTIASEIMLRSPEPLHDRALGLNVSFLFLGPFLNPWLIAPLRESHGIGFAIAAVASAYVLAGVLFLVLHLAGQRRPAAA